MRYFPLCSIIFVTNIFKCLRVIREKTVSLYFVNFEEIFIAKIKDSRLYCHLNGKQDVSEIIHGSLEARLHQVNAKNA